MQQAMHLHNIPGRAYRKCRQDGLMGLLKEPKNKSLVNFLYCRIVYWYYLTGRVQIGSQEDKRDFSSIYETGVNIEMDADKLENIISGLISLHFMYD